MVGFAESVSIWNQINDFLAPLNSLVALAVGIFVLSRIKKLHYTPQLNESPPERTERLRFAWLSWTVALVMIWIGAWLSLTQWFSVGLQPVAISLLLRPAFLLVYLFIGGIYMIAAIQLQLQRTARDAVMHRVSQRENGSDPQRPGG